HDRRAADGAEAARSFCRGVLVAHERGLALGDAKALAPAADIGGVGGAMGAAARGGMIMPGPARGHVDLEGDLAAQAFSGGGLAGRDRLGFSLWWFVFVEHRGPLVGWAKQSASTFTIALVKVGTPLVRLCPPSPIP